MSVALAKKIGKSIAGRYCITGTVGEGGMGAVFSAISFDDPSHTVAIKVIQHNRKLHSEDLLRFQIEASLMSQLHHPGIVAFHELGILSEDQREEFGQGYYIVMEIVDGKNLKEIVLSKGKCDLDFFFQVGLQVSSALDYTHAKDIIHRDIKPQNVVIGKTDPKDSEYQVKLLDFGVARFGESMNFTGQDLDDDVAGTPLYMAPELLTRVDEPVDHRVDLYSLGCMLYEMLAGSTPFVGRARDALAHAHAMESPAELEGIRPDLPLNIVNIVHKLLKKRPDDRYRTAHSVHVDLLRARRSNKAACEVRGREPQNRALIDLARNDKYQAISAKLDLVGRGDEVDTLLSFYDEIESQSARSRISVIRGPGGIGKTRVISELRSKLKERNVRFVSGCFSQHESLLPFNALANAFNEYLLKVLKSQPEEAAEIKNKVRSSLGSSAHMVASIVPGLHPYIQDVPPLDEEFDVNGSDFSTFSKAFSDFTLCLVTGNQPVVFILDDLHWSDEKSMKLIDHFFSNNNSQKFYLIISYHPNQLEQNEGLSAFLKKFSKLRRRYQVIDLTPLKSEAIAKIGTNILAQKEILPQNLCLFLVAQAEGNPRYLVELLRALVEMDQIKPDTSGSSWDYDIDEIVGQPIRLATIELVLSRIQALENEYLEVLEYASVSGMGFYFESLLLNVKIDNLTVMKVLQRAQQDGIIIPSQGDSGLRHLGRHYQFSHKKARDEIYFKIGISKQSELHRVFGLHLESIVIDADPTVLYALAHHFSQAVKTGLDLKVAKKCLGYCLRAAVEADEAGSLQSSEKYFQTALEQIKIWGTRLTTPEQTLYIYEKMADLLAKQKKHGIAIQAYKKILKTKPSAEIALPIVHKIVHFQLVGGVVSESLRLINKALISLGRPLPKASFVLRCRAYGALILDVYGFYFRASPSMKVLGKTVSDFHRGVKTAIPESVAVELYHAAQFANFRENPGLALISHFLAFVECGRRTADPSRRLQTIADRSVVLKKLKHHRTASRLLEKVLATASLIGCERMVGYCLYLRAIHFSYPSGACFEADRDLQEASLLMDSEEDRQTLASITLFQSFRQFLRGETSEASALADRVLRMVSTRNVLSSRAVSFVLISHLFCDERDRIVSKGEEYLQRFRVVAGRENDVFVLLIRALVGFAKGSLETNELRDARRIFQMISLKYSHRSVDDAFFVFEEDFLGLFLMIFPVFFESQHGCSIVSTDEEKHIQRMFDLRIMAGAKMIPRDISSLLLAWVLDRNKRSDKLGVYQNTIRLAAKSENKLLRILARYLEHSMSERSGFSGRKIYSGAMQETSYRGSSCEGAGNPGGVSDVRIASLGESLRDSHDLGLDGLTRHIRNSFLRLVGDGSSKYLLKETRTSNSRFSKYPTDLAFEHLIHLSSLPCSLPYSFSPEKVNDSYLRKSIELLMSWYAGSNAHVIVFDEYGNNTRTIFTSNGDGKPSLLEDFIAPYQDIDSVLFLPSSDVPTSEQHSPLISSGFDAVVNMSRGSKNEVKGGSEGESEGLQVRELRDDASGQKSSEGLSESKETMEKTAFLDLATKASLEVTAFLDLATTVGLVENDSRDDAQESYESGSCHVGQDLDSTSIVTGADGDGEDRSTLIDTDSTVPAGSSGDELLSSSASSKSGHVNVSKRCRPQMAMCAVIPICSVTGTIGILLLENIGQVYRISVSQSKKELKLFGSQVGVLLQSLSSKMASSENKSVSGRSQRGKMTSSSFSSHDQERADLGRLSDRHQAGRQVSQKLARKMENQYIPGRVRLEESSWLRLWQHGRLRETRESTWYFGADISSDFYFTCFCAINGKKKYRDRLSCLIWYYLVSLRTLNSDSRPRGSKNDEEGAHKAGVFDLARLKEDIIEIIQQDPAFKYLDGISIAMTVFDRKAKSVYTGHFGPARPSVIGGENKISPHNEVVLRLNGEKDVRYWNVVGKMEDYRPFIVSFDTSRLGVRYDNKFYEKLGKMLKCAVTSRELHDILEGQLRSGDLPRCYLGAMLCDYDQQNKNPTDCDSTDVEVRPFRISQ